MKGFIACDISKFCVIVCNKFEADNKLIYIIHLKSFLFQLDHVLLLKYI
jgi:hypothetical protein